MRGHCAKIDEHEEEAATGTGINRAERDEFLVTANLRSPKYLFRKNDSNVTSIKIGLS